MPKRSILVADDIENRSESGRRRSKAVLYTASILAQWLNTGIRAVNNRKHRFCTVSPSPFFNRPFYKYN